MNKVVKWVLIVVGSLLLLLVIAAGALAVYGQTKFKPTVQRPVYPIQADTSSAGIARGKYIVNSLGGCVDCHSPQSGEFLAGHSEELALGALKATLTFPNLTPDPASGLGSWSDAEIARAIREGLDKDGRGLIIMPAFNYHVMSDADVAAVVGYLRSLQPVQNTLPATTGNLPAKILLALGAYGPNPLGNPITTAQNAPEPGTPEYGLYITTLAGCHDCHGANYAGGKRPDAPPDAPHSPNLTPGGELAGWNEAGFITAMRTGLTPSGKALDPSMMPWKVYGGMSDQDLAAIFSYLKSLDALPNN